jgi:hypothetical protein
VGKEAWGIIYPGEVYSCALNQSEDKAQQRLPAHSLLNQNKSSPSARVLGVILDKKLSWQPHLQHIKSKLATQTNVFTQLMASTWGASL